MHIKLGAADYQRIRSTEQPVLGANPDKDPGAEFTMLARVDALWKADVDFKNSREGFLRKIKPTGVRKALKSESLRPD